MDSGEKNKNSIPLVSFVVVTHNRPIELVQQRIIESISNQDYSNKELILVGESCEKLDALVKKIKEKQYDLKNFKWTNLSRPTGKMNYCIWGLVSRCRNIGIRLAEGEYISCQDDDNEIKPDFASSLLRCIVENNAEAAWCFRKVKMPDGTPFKGDYFPWIENAPHRERLVYQIWKDAGIFTPGSDVMKDQLCASNKTEIFSSVDANEWLVKADVFRQFPYRERFGFSDIYSYLSFDDLWNTEIRKASVHAVCSGKVGLIYYLGGMSTSVSDSKFSHIHKKCSKK